ncbi:MAG TPA: hypothetical protein VLH08_03765 [Acidobacteriota bacterium]|nr:hypothetical protein [Acidobacteriota bacterium]
MKRFLVAIAALVLLSPGLAQACAVCFGDPSSPLTIGAKAGVAFMLGVLVIVLGGIFAMCIFWARRSRLAQVQSILRGENPS